jgi:hypothetical protein
MWETETGGFRVLGQPKLRSEILSHKTKKITKPNKVEIKGKIKPRLS